MLSFHLQNFQYWLVHIAPQTKRTFDQVIPGVSGVFVVVI